MTGERWPDKRARAVFVAGARAHDAADDTAEAVAELGLAIREHLFVDDEVREDTADAKSRRIGYARDCMQFATLEPDATGIIVGLWLPESSHDAARDRFGAQPDPNPFRQLYGWQQLHIGRDADVADLAAFVREAAEHAALQKAQQGTQAVL